MAFDGIIFQGQSLKIHAGLMTTSPCRSVRRIPLSYVPGVMGSEEH